MADPDALARRCAEVMWADDRASQALGMELVDVGAGRAVLRMTVRADMANGHAIGHGGFTFALADSAFAFACNTYDRRTVAQGCDISFLAAVRVGDVLEARAVERFRAGRNGIYDVTVLRGDDVVAEFRGRSREIGGRLTEEERSDG
ncbi:MAG: hydroxyphenylacetyl-CoA thioesterase PaaI [Propionibacteriales bacterium]|nr:hydroxyphenylacetyl-CoA thioesterase PaaI [Propionibacteriales bacterium]